jgi:protein CpxP
MSEPVTSNPSPPQSPRRRRFLLIGGAVVGVLALMIGAGQYVLARGDGWRHGWGGPMSSEALAARVEHGVNHLLADIDATAEQKQQVTAILQAAAADVHALRDQHVAAHRQIHDILSAESIDRVRLENLRADEMRLADEASRRIVEGVADAAEVLTAQQRAQLIQSMEKHHEKHHDWHEEETEAP